MKPHVLVLIASTGLLLAGCNEPIVPQCPSAAILSDTATVTSLRPGAPADPSGEVYTASISAVKTSCIFDKKEGLTISDLDFTMRATRAPSPDAATYSVPYYIAVTQGERLLSKQVYTLQLNFAPGSASVTQDDDIAETNLKLENGHPPTDYQLLIGFQLTDAQRAYNQIRSRFLP